MSSRTESDPLLSPVAVSEVSDSSVLPTMAENHSYIYLLKIMAACVHTLAYSLISACLFVVLWFAFKSSPIGAFELHIILSVIGYQLLMSYGILSLNNNTIWSSPLTVLHRRRAHWILQLIGSGLAIAGSLIMMRKKTVNFNSTHGKLALAALILTSISLINGVMTLYRVGVSRVLPSKVFKVSHLCLGTAAFAVSSVCLAFGYNKKSFREWATDELSYIIIGMTITYTVIVIYKPCCTLWKKFTAVIKVKIF